MTGILVYLAVGLTVGLLAAAMTGERSPGRGWSILLGVVGSSMGSLLFRALGMSQFGLVGQIVTGTVGACLVLFIVDRVLYHNPG